MPSGGEHSRTKERGRILPFLHGWRSFLGNRPPQRGREKSLSSYCCHHRHPRGATHTKGSSKVCQVGHGSTPILTCGSCRGDPPAICYTEDEEKSPSPHPDYFHQPTIQPPKGSITTKVSPASQSTGISKAAHTTSWLFQVAACLKTLELVEVDW